MGTDASTPLVENHSLCLRTRQKRYLYWQFYYMGLDARKPVFRVCKQQKRKPACASVQSDQLLCYSLYGKYHIESCYKRSMVFLASLCSWAGCFESHVVKYPVDRFYRIAAHISPESICSEFSFKIAFLWDLGSFKWAQNLFMKKIRKMFPICLKKQTNKSNLDHKNTLYCSTVNPV